MHADGYTMTYIIDKGCANHNPTQALIIRIIFMLWYYYFWYHFEDNYYYNYYYYCSCFWNTMDIINKNNNGRGLIHPEGLYDDKD